MKTGTSWRSVIYAGSFVVANHRGNLSFGKVSSTAFLVYVAAILLYKPIFTQPLGFFLCAAGAVEKSATERAVSVVYSRDSIDISKINAAFLTGQQIDRIHVQQLPLLGHFSSGALPEFRIATNCCSCLRELTPSFS